MKGDCSSESNSELINTGGKETPSKYHSDKAIPNQDSFSAGQTILMEVDKKIEMTETEKDQIYDKGINDSKAEKLENKQVG